MSNTISGCRSCGEPGLKTFLDLGTTPLADAMFQLLIFFMLSSTAVNQGLDVDLPDAETAERINSQEITLSIGKDGKLMLQNQSVSLEALPEAVKRSLDDNGHQTLIIQADKEIEFDLFGQVLDQTRQAQHRP